MENNNELDAAIRRLKNDVLVTPEERERAREKYFEAVGADNAAIKDTTIDEFRAQIAVGEAYRKTEDEDINALASFLRGLPMNRQMSKRVAKRLLGRVPPNTIAYR